jgi:hypothetical protein
MNNKHIIIGIDYGFFGGISILNKKNKPIMYKMPIIKHKYKVKGKERIKKKYDLLKIIEIFNNHLPKNKDSALIILERVSSMPGEGVRSSFVFGEGFGSLEGVIAALSHKLPILITPQTWKKVYPALMTDEMKEKKLQIKEKRLEKQNTKEINKLNRQIKNESKIAARKLVCSLYPQLVDDLKLVNSDGMAESVLIALYGRNHYELVQDI